MVYRVIYEIKNEKINLKLKIKNRKIGIIIKIVKQIEYLFKNNCSIKYERFNWQTNSFWKF